MLLTKESMDQQDADYRADAETPVNEYDLEPLVNPVKSDSPEMTEAVAKADDQAKAFSDAWNTNDRAAVVADHKGDAPAAPVAPGNFKEAFAKARADGLKVFEWQGKKFTTEVAGSKPAAAKPISLPSKESTAPKSFATNSATPVHASGKPNLAPAAGKPLIDTASMMPGAQKLMGRAKA